MKRTDDIDDPTWHDIFDRDGEIKRLKAELESREPRSNEIHEDFQGLRKVTGRGDFSLERLSKNKWVMKLNDETIILYNRRGRRVRGTLGGNYGGAQ
jgi:hypothetical protein